MTQRKLIAQDISWFLDLYATNQLDLDPPYQRRSVWSLSDKRFFIDTIINNYPSPLVYLHMTHEQDRRNVHHVVDGKQRLLTILEFTKNKFTSPVQIGNTNLEHKSWADLDSDTKSRFRNYLILIELLYDVNEPALKNIFDRLNRNTCKLNRQELRHAKYDGWFISYVESEAERSDWKRSGVVSGLSGKRMMDVQFISELIAVVLTGKIQGFDQDMLDDLHAEYNDNIAIGDLSTEKRFFMTIKIMKKRIFNIIEVYPPLKKYLKIQNHFYTLWVYLFYNRVRNNNPFIFIRNYVKFLDDVHQTLNSPEHEPVSEFTSDYAANCRGASTDYMQRKYRYVALLQWLQEQKATSDEDL